MFYRINTQLYVQTVKLGVSILRLSLNDFYRYSIIRSFMTNVIDKINSVCLLSDDTIQALKESVTLCHFPKKHLLIKENTFCKFAYFIEKGMTRSFWLVNGEEITTSFSCEGGIVFSMDVGVNLAVSFSCIVGCPICKIYLVDHGYRNFKEKIHFME